MNLRKYFLYCLSFSLVFFQSTAFGFVANNTNLNTFENNTELNTSESYENNKPEFHENYVKYSHTSSGLIAIVKNEQTHCAIPIHEELQTEIELNLPEIQKQNKTEFPTDTQVASNEQIQDLTVCPPELAQELLDSGFISEEMQYSVISPWAVVRGMAWATIFVPTAIVTVAAICSVLDRKGVLADKSKNHICNL